MYKDRHDTTDVPFWDMTENYRATIQELRAEHASTFGMLALELGRLTTVDGDYDALHRIDGLIDEARRFIYIRPYEEDSELVRVTVNRVIQNPSDIDDIAIDDFVVDASAMSVRHIGSRCTSHKNDPNLVLDAQVGPVLDCYVDDDGWFVLKLVPGREYAIDPPEDHALADFPAVSPGQRVRRFLGSVTLYDEDLANVMGRIDDTLTARLLTGYLEPLGANTKVERAVLPVTPST